MVTIGLTGADYSVSEGAGSVEVCVGVAVGSLEREAVISLFTSNGTAIGEHVCEYVCVHVHEHVCVCTCACVHGACEHVCM